MYKPNVFFMKQLKDLDKNLGCIFNSTIERFIVTYKRSVGIPVPIMRIESDDGSFRQPDQRDINKLVESDTQRVSMDERLKISSKYMYDYREKKQMEAKENIRLMTIDDRKQLRRAVGRLYGPKVDASIFRKIIHKPRGKVF